MVDEVYVYKTNWKGDTKTKKLEKDDPYYINGYCYKNNGKKGWSYLNVYDYVYYEEDGKISCQ